MSTKSKWEQNTVVINEGWSAYCLLCEWRAEDFAVGRGAKLAAKEHWDTRHAFETESKG